MAWDMHEAIAYYKSQGAPGDQNALVGLLREAQQENGGVIPAELPATAAGSYGVKESFILALIRRIPSLRLSDVHVLEFCGGKNCGRKTPALADYARKKWGSRIEVRMGACMRLCAKGPNIRLDGKVYHQADEKLLDELLGK